jgi:hypothetical protein
MEELGTDQQLTLRSILSGLEQAFPIEGLFADYADNPSTVSQPEMPDEDCAILLEMMYASFQQDGLTLDETLKRLQSSPVFRMNNAAAHRTLEKFREPE